MVLRGAVWVRRNNPVGGIVGKKKKEKDEKKKTKKKKVKLREICVAS